MAATFKRIFRQDLTKPLQIYYNLELVFSKDNLANEIQIELYNGSDVYSGGGSVSGTAIRADGRTVPIENGTISGNVVTVALTEECMDVPGTLQVYVKLTSGNVKTTIFAGVFTAIRTETDAIIDPGTIIPSITELINQIDAAIDSIPADYSTLLGSVASTYSASKTYAVGDYVWYNGQLYRCSTAITTAEAWTAAHWTSAVISDDVTGLKSALTNLEEEISEGAGGLTPAIKEALLQIARKTTYVDAHGQDYYDDLYEALYNVTSIIINPSSVSLDQIGATAQLTARTIPSGNPITWASSNPNIATVDQTGLVTSVGYGNTTIVASSGNVAASCSILVAELELLSISAIYTQSSPVYDTDTLARLTSDVVVTAHWDNGTDTIIPSTEYTLSGSLTVGQSVITVSYGGKTDTFTVTVSEGQRYLQVSDFDETMGFVDLAVTDGTMSYSSVNNIFGIVTLKDGMMPIFTTNRSFACIFQKIDEDNYIGIDAKTPSPYVFRFTRNANNAFSASLISDYSQITSVAITGNCSGNAIVELSQSTLTLTYPTGNVTITNANTYGLWSSSGTPNKFTNCEVHYRGNL